MGPFVVFIILAAFLFFLVHNPFQGVTRTCPVSRNDRIWIEKTVSKLIAIYGKDRFLKTRTILPDYKRFPRPYENSERFATQLFDEVCDIMALDPDYIDLEFGETGIEPDDLSHEGGSRFAPGSYSPDYDQLVTLDLNMLHGFDQLITVIAHELSHVSLDREVFEELDHSNEEYESTVDMGAIFLGFGIFMARTNSAYSLSNGRRRLGYLSLPVICYAQAFICWKRSEDIAHWKEYLGKDAFTLMMNSYQMIQSAHNRRRPHTTPSESFKNSDLSLELDKLLDVSAIQDLSTPPAQSPPQIEQMLQEAKERQANILKVKSQNKEQNSDMEQ